MLISDIRTDLRLVDDCSERPPENNEFVQAARMHIFQLVPSLLRYMHLVIRFGLKSFWKLLLLLPISIHNILRYCGDGCAIFLDFLLDVSGRFCFKLVKNSECWTLWNSWTVEEYVVESEWAMWITHENIQMEYGGETPPLGVKPLRTSWVVVLTHTHTHKFKPDKDHQWPEHLRYSDVSSRFNLTLRWTHKHSHSNK